MTDFLPELLAATLSTGSKAAACKTNIPEIRNNVKIYLKFKQFNLICSVETAFRIHTKIGTFCTNEREMLQVNECMYTYTEHMYKHM